jgi:transcriptional regulator with XRE-family HTH domain
VRLLREGKKFSQGDIEKRTGLIRCYISRVENGHTIPSLNTLERLAKALETPLHLLLYDGDKPPQARAVAEERGDPWGRTGKDARFLGKLRRQLAKMSGRDREALLAFVRALARPEGNPRAQEKVAESAESAKTA